MTMDLTGKNEYYLEPGYVYFSKTASVVRSVVGSCVVVCLWDKNLRYGGMSHFVRPRARDRSSATPQYGNVGTVALVRLMLEAGSHPQDLMAQIMGGGSPEKGTEGMNVGQENVEVAREVLSRQGIRVVSEDVGGSMGRKVIFDTGTGQTVVLKVQRIRDSDWRVEPE